MGAFLEPGIEWGPALPEHFGRGDADRPAFSAEGKVSKGDAFPAAVAVKGVDWRGFIATLD